MNYHEMAWRAYQRDWLVHELRNLIRRWENESDTPNTFAPDESVDKIARGRTGGCAVMLREILEKLA